jgi:hypothetical protein
MHLTLREGYSTKFCIKFVAMTCHHNYYSQMYGPFCELVQNGPLPLIKQWTAYTSENLKCFGNKNAVTYLNIVAKG